MFSNKYKYVKFNFLIDVNYCGDGWALELMQIKKQLYYSLALSDNILQRNIFNFKLLGNKISFII